MPTTISSYTLASASVQNIDVSYETYSLYYNEEGWLSRKALAVPKFCIAIVLKTTYHVAMAIIIGVPQFIDRDSKRFQAELCNAGRDIEEAYGCILIIFNDQRGSFHQERSDFFKEKNIVWATKGEDFFTPPVIVEEAAPPPPPPPLPPTRTFTEKTYFPVPRLDTPFNSPPRTPRRQSFQEMPKTPQDIKLLRRVRGYDSPGKMPSPLRRQYISFLTREVQHMRSRLAIEFPMLSPQGSPQRERGGVPPAPPPAPPFVPPAAPPPPPPFQNNPGPGPVVPPAQTGRGGLLAAIQGFNRSELDHASPVRRDHRTAQERLITARRGAIGDSPQNVSPPSDLISQLRARILQTQQTITVLEEEESDWEDSPVARPQPRPIQLRTPPRSPYVAPLQTPPQVRTPLQMESPPRTPVRPPTPQHRRQRRNSDPGSPAANTGVLSLQQRLAMLRGNGFNG